MTGDPVAPQGPVYSPDGRYIWDGTRWVGIVHDPLHSPVPRRHPFLYVIVSFFITGLGTVFAGRVLRGLFLLALDAGLLIWFDVLADPFRSVAFVQTPFGKAVDCTNGLSEPNSRAHRTSRWRRRDPCLGVRHGRCVAYGTNMESSARMGPVELIVHATGVRAVVVEQALPARTKEK